MTKLEKLLAIGLIVAGVAVCPVWGMDFDSDDQYYDCEEQDFGKNEQQNSQGSPEIGAETGLNSDDNKANNIDSDDDADDIMYHGPQLAADQQQNPQPQVNNGQGNPPVDNDQKPQPDMPQNPPKPPEPAPAPNPNPETTQKFVISSTTLFSISAAAVGGILSLVQ